MNKRLCYGKGLAPRVVRLGGVLVERQLSYSTTRRPLNPC
ncbi:unnamed protein product [Ixodes persulcatus]